jgi:hypothetical protein
MLPFSRTGATMADDGDYRVSLGWQGITRLIGLFLALVGGIVFFATKNSWAIGFVVIAVIVIGIAGFGESSLRKRRGP